MNVKVSNVNQPVWKECNIHATLPADLSKLQEIAYNVWWSWNGEAKDLFRYIDTDAWHRANSNPIVLLNIISYDRMVELSQDKKFMARLNMVYDEFRAYMDTPKDKKKPTIAYFSMEYGLTHVLKIYSGGLGILAGDYIKEASDCNVDMTAIGFLYRYGYFTQTLSPEGQQIANYEAQNFSNLPISQVKEADGSNMVIEVPYPGRTVKAYLWKVAVGRMDLTIKLANGNVLYDKAGNVVTPNAKGFEVTGIIIGGQKAVDQDFNPITDSNSKQYAIYDNSMSNMYASSNGSDTNYTLTLPSAAEEVVNIAIELINNTGQNFEGATGIIPNGGKFYLIANLNPPAAKSGYTNELNQVFKQDYITTVKLTIPQNSTEESENHETGLGNAYNVLPDLSKSLISFGFSVDPSWQSGLYFEVEL